MNNYLRILSIHQDKAHRATFVSAREEGGINSTYDPELDKEVFQVFIHNRLPFKALESWDFDTFEKARDFAAGYFKEGWEILSWDGSLQRPCQKRGDECGQGSCDECKAGGGCKTCGVDDDEEGCGSC